MSAAPAPRQRLVSIAVVAALGCAWLVAGRDLVSADIAIYLIASYLFSADLIDAVVRVIVRRGGAPARAQLHWQHAARMQPYAYLFSVHDLARDVDQFIARHAHHRERVWIVDDHSGDPTALRLRAAGFRCLTLARNVKKPAALRRLLVELPAEVRTVIVLDPDSHFLTAERDPEAFERCIAEFQRGGAAALCPRVTVYGERFLDRLQRLEYALSFGLGRASLAEISTTSGLAVYRRDALERTLEAHSLSVYAEDLENTLIMLARGERIVYDGRLLIETEPKSTLAGWFSQRCGWSFGLAKVFFERCREIGAISRRGPQAFYQYVVYLGVISILSTPFKVASMALLALSFANALEYLTGTALIPDGTWTEPQMFALVYVKYLLLITLVTCLAAPRREWPGLLVVTPVYFFYVVLHVLPHTIGCLNWVLFAVSGRRLFEDHYDDGQRMRERLRNGREKAEAL